MTPLGCFPRRPNRNLRQLLLLSAEAPNRRRDLGLRHTRQLLRRRRQTACELTLPSRPLSSPRQVLIDGGPRKLLVQFFCEFSEGNTNLDWLPASRGQGPQGDVSKSRHVLVLEAGKRACEKGEHLSRCTERLLQIQSNLRLQKTSIVDEALRRGAKRVYAGTRSALQNTDKRVTPLTLDVTSVSEIQRAAGDVDSLDVLINNAGVAIYDDLSNLDVIEQHLAVNFLGPLKVTQAFLPLLSRSKGAIVNNLSLASLAPLPVVPAYSISKAAAFNMTQSLRALLAGQGVTVHAVVLGPVDTDMNRGFEIPKASPESAALRIFDGLEKGEEDIFPDPASLSIAEGWRSGAVKALERQFGTFVPDSAANVG